MSHDPQQSSPSKLKGWMMILIFVVSLALLIGAEMAFYK